MSMLDEPNGSAGGTNGEETSLEQMSRSALEARVRELERENAALKAAARNDHRLLDALAVQGIPADQDEMQELHGNSKSISDVLAELA